MAGRWRKNCAQCGREYCYTGQCGEAAWEAKYCSSRCLVAGETNTVQRVFTEHNTTLGAWCAVDEALDSYDYAKDAARAAYFHAKVK